MLKHNCPSVELSYTCTSSAFSPLCTVNYHVCGSALRQVVKKKKGHFSSTVKRWYLYDYIDDCMYESMYSVQILTKIFIHFVRKRKKKEDEMRKLNEMCPGVKVESGVLTERTTEDTAIVSKTNIQKYKRRRKCPFTFSLYIISLYV